MDDSRKSALESDIAHPLSTLTSNWLNCRDEVQIDEKCQPVLLDDCVYTKGSSDHKPVVWKYSTTAKSWSILPAPPGLELDQYALTTYCGQLILVGGHNELPPNGVVPNENIFTFDLSNGWRVDENIPSLLPEVLKCEILSATSSDDYLIVVYGEDSNVKLSIFDGKDSKEWKIANGPCARNSYSVDVIIKDCTVYLLEYLTSQLPCLHSASLTSLLEPNSDSWLKVTKLPHQISNLTQFAGFLIVVTISPPCLIAILPDSKKCIPLGNMSFVAHTISYKIRIPTIICISKKSIKFLIMGHIKTEYPEKVDLSLRHPYFDILEVSVEGNPFSPDKNITVEAVMKLKECCEIKGFDKLVMKLSIMKEKAGFSMSDYLPLSNTYDDQMLPKYIWSWVNDEKAFLPPTWKNFFHILREPGMGLSDLADDIEKYLVSTSESIVHPPTKQNTTGLQELAVLRSELESCQGSHKCSCDKELQSFKIQMDTCLDQCKVAFRKVGEEQREYDEKIEKLTKENQQLSIREARKQGFSQKPALKELMRRLKEVAADWEDLGVELDYNDGELKKIKADNSGDSKACLRQLLSQWLKHVDPEPSWEAIAEAVEVGLENPKLAKEVRQL